MFCIKAVSLLFGIGCICASHLGHDHHDGYSYVTRHDGHSDHHGGHHGGNDEGVAYGGGAYGGYSLGHNGHEEENNHHQHQHQHHDEDDHQDYYVSENLF